MTTTDLSDYAGRLKPDVARAAELLRRHITDECRRAFNPPPRQPHLRIVATQQKEHR